VGVLHYAGGVLCDPLSILRTARIAYYAKVVKADFANLAFRSFSETAF